MVTITVNGRPVSQCPRRCSECSGALHHWIELFPTPGPDLNARDREIIGDWAIWVKSSQWEAPVCPMAWGCKHCQVWIRYYDSCDFCGGPVDENLDCITV